ncbi:MAG: nitroreductase family protein [Alphaproteobacteria bacterium]|nr:nitroreductase family protein [Alphaproteobacteria bacterium]
MVDIADLIETRFGLASEAGRGHPAEGAVATALNHRSHRRYSDRPVDDETLEILLSAAFSAPAKSDLQQSAVVIVRDPTKRAALADLVPSLDWVATCPVMMIFCADSRRIRRVCEMRGKPFDNDHLDAVLNGAVDTGLVMGFFIQAAQALGLGCCPISVVRNRIEEIAALLELPAHVFPVAGMTLGWPSTPGHVSTRLPLSVFVHEDRYDDSDLAAEIDGYDRRRDARYQIPAEKQRLNETYGPAKFYGWSEDKARQVSVRERDQLARFMRAQGFNLD